LNLSVCRDWKAIIHAKSMANARTLTVVTRFMPVSQLASGNVRGMTRDEVTDSDSVEDFPPGHILRPEPLEHPVSQWEPLAATTGGNWLFVITLRPGNPYGERHATAYDPGAGVLYSATLDGYDRLTHVEVTVPGDRLGAVVDIPRAARELRAFMLSRGETAQLPTPTTTEVAELLRRGVKRAEIAARYGRPSATVDNWIRAARAAHPDVPQARRGPRAETSEPNPALDNRGESPTTKGNER
jgi:hypothetical protein